MNTKKKDLEIVYSLRWKNGPKRDDKKQMSIVAVYDIPSTTLNFEVFKSYLLKNSGIAEDDVSVYYIMENGKEYPIQSQIDFQVALYAFRRKARVGEIINLLLERISDKAAQKNFKHSNDVETQFDNLEQSSIVSTGTCCAGDMPPEWFVAGLAQLKKDIKEEVSANVAAVIANAMADLKSSCPYRLKSKPEKRHKKIIPHVAENVSDAKSLTKSLKLENKLEKLERKASKYREKRLALQPNGVKSSDSEAGPSHRRKSRETEANKACKLEQQKRNTEEENDGNKSDREPLMDARPVKVQASLPHMIGGEQYTHEWEVQNTGQDQWTSLTTLQYTWGSKSLIPLKKCLTVPFLKPGEKGIISVSLLIPSQPGKYECYWQFMHKGKRFGHWLGAQVIVDPYKPCFQSVFENSIEFDSSLISGDVLKPIIEYKNKEDILRIASLDLEAFLLTEDEDPEKNNSSNPDDSDCSWSSEPTNLLTKNNKKDVVPIPQCFVIDSPVKEGSKVIASTSGLQFTPQKEENNFDDNNNTESVGSGSTIKITDDELDNIVLITLPKDDHVKEGFIYVHVDGQKVLIPKNLLKSELVDAAQKLGENSIGVAVGSNESINKSSTPSLKNEKTNSDNTLDSAKLPTTLEDPIILVDSALPKTFMEDPASQGNITNNDVTLQITNNDVAVDLSTPPRNNIPDLDENVEQRSNYFEANNYMSHCSAAGSCFSEVNASMEKRMFVFPQNIPGYEVIYPPLDLNTPEQPNLINQPVATPSRPKPACKLPQQPLVNPFVEPVPNFQQTPPELRRAPVDAAMEPPLYATAQHTHFGNSCVDSQQQTLHQEEPQPVRETAAPSAASPQEVHILPETLVNGAVNAASSAINTVMNMIKPQSPGRWVNGHRVSASPETPREANLQALAEMGFWNRDLNATLLARFDDDLNRVVAELVQ